MRDPQVVLARHLSLMGLAAFGMYVTTTPGIAQPAFEVVRRGDELSSHTKSFEAVRATAKKKAIDDFDEIIRNVRNRKGITAAAKNALVEQFKQAKQNFEERGEWPDDESMLKAQFRYAKAISVEHRKGAKHVDQLIGLADRPGNAAEVKRLKNLKQEFDALIPGRASIRAGAKWEGTRSGIYLAQLKEVLTITKFNDPIIEGRVEINPRSRTPVILDVKGEISGGLFQLNVTKVVLAQKLQARAFTGLLLGEGRMLLIDGGYDGTGKPIGGIAILKD